MVRHIAPLTSLRFFAAFAVVLHHLSDFSRVDIHNAAVDRATLVAFYIHGRSLKQMSREFETPIGTIKRRLHVARNRLRRHLDAYDEGGEAGSPRRGEAACV